MFDSMPTDNILDIFSFIETIILKSILFSIINYSARQEIRRTTQLGLVDRGIRVQRIHSELLRSDVLRNGSAGATT